MMSNKQSPHKRMSVGSSFFHLRKLLGSQFFPSFDVFRPVGFNTVFQSSSSEKIFYAFLLFFPLFRRSFNCFADLCVRLEDQLVKTDFSVLVYIKKVEHVLMSCKPFWVVKVWLGVDIGVFAMNFCWSFGHFG